MNGRPSRGRRAIGNFPTRWLAHPLGTRTMSDYYADDLSPDESYVTLERADDILSQTLAGRTWTERAALDRQLATEDPDHIPQRGDDKSALRDATAALDGLPWKGTPVTVNQPRAFPRRLYDLQGRLIAGIPEAVEKATALLAAHLLENEGQSITPDLFRSYRVGESSGVFRTTTPDALPKHVRTAIAGLIEGATTWSPVRP